MVRKSETIKLTGCDIIKETEKAWLILHNDEETWIPKSVGQWDERTDTMEIDSWFANKEGLS